MGKQRDNSSLRPNRPQIEELEPRILYSADALAFAPDPAAGVEIRTLDAAFADLTQTTASRPFSDTLSAEQSVAPQEIVFVDTGIDGYEELLEDLLLSLPEDTQPAIILLDTKTDGIEQISSSLAEYQNVSAIHILSHADSGEVTLGSTTLDNANLDDFANTLLGWNDYLTTDADILIYGCNLAASDDGVALIDNIAALTGADVAASDDLTGNAAVGGDWDLEYRVGEIEALTLTASSASTWDGTLATLTPTAEQRVNTSTVGVQETSAQSLGSHNAVAMDSAGNYVVVWTDSGTDGSGYGIFAQRFDAAGTKQGAEFQVNETSANDQYWASVAMADNGNFTVTWTSVNQDGTASSIYARQFNADGTPAGSEFRVNTTASGGQSNSTIAMNQTTGDFIIAWQGSGSGDSDGIYFRLFDASGNGGTETRVNSGTSGAQTDPTVAMNDNGASAIVWTDGSDTTLDLIDASGNVLGVETNVNYFAGSSQAAVALDNNGNSIVAFAYNGFGDDGVYFRRFNSSGGDIDGHYSAPPSVSTSASSDATAPSLAMDPATGNFVVTWEESADGSGKGVFARAFMSDKTLLWDTVQINQTTTNDQINASVAMLDTGNFVVAWSGEGVGDSSGVFARQFGTVAPNATAVASDANGNFVKVWETRSITGDSWDIVAQRYDIDGNTVGSQFTVNQTTTDGDQTDPDVAMDANGNFVVSWSSGGDVLYRVFDSNASATTNERLANTTTAGEQAYTSVAYDGLGDFLITWSSQGQDDSGDATGWGVYAQRFLADGSLKDGEFLVNTTTAGDQMYSDVSADDYGDFVIAWQGNGGSTGWDIYSKLYRDSGAVLSDERLRNSETAGDQHSVSIAMEADGDYSLAWVSEGQDGDGGGIYFDNVAWGGSGTNTSGELRVNSTTAGDQQNVQMASDPTGNLVITWTSTGQDGDSSNETNLYRQLYRMKNSGPEVQGSEALVNTYTTNNQGNPAVTADPSGNVIFTWSGELAGGVYGTDQRILLNAMNNQTPTVSLANPSLDYTENAPPLAIDPALTVADPDSANLAGATVQIRDGFTQGEDELSFTAQAGISGNYDAATGILSFSGSATVTDYETLLRSVSYRNNSDNPSTAQRVIEFTVDDGTASSSDRRKLNVAAVNDAPSLDSTALNIDENSSSLSLSATDPEGDSITYSLTGGSDASLFTLDASSGELTFNTAPDYEAPGDSDSNNVYDLTITTTDANNASRAQNITVTVANLNDAPPILSAIENSPLAYTENAPATAVSSSLVLSDADSSNIDSAVIQITANYQNGEDLLAFTDTGNISATWDAATGTLTLSGSDSLANYQAALRSVTYSNGSDTPSTATRTLSFSVSDGSNSSTPQSRDIAITTVNDSPSLNTNTGVSVLEGSSVTLTSSQLNASDPDDSAIDLTYSVTGGLANGHLERSNNPGVAISSFTQDEIDNNRVIYFHDGSQTSSDNFSFSLVDGGEDGVSALTGTFSITVSNTNDAPLNTVPGAQSVNEDTPLAITGLSVADADDNIATVELTVADGILNVTLYGSATVSDGANGSTSLTLTGSQADINTTLGTLTYQGNLNFNGNDTLTVRSTDTFGASDTDTVDITVNPVNDEEALDTNAGLVLDEGSSATISSSLLASSDIEQSAAQIVYSLTALPGHGSLALNGTPLNTGDTFTQDDIDNNRVSYVHDAGESTSDSLALTVDDGLGSVTAVTFSITINPVNDAPTATDHTVTTSEDTTYRFTTTDFSFSDVDGDMLSAVQITSLESAGALQLNGTDVVLNQVIGRADIDAGNLTFTPAANVNGAGYASYGFKVYDGSAYSVSSYTMSIDVTAVDDAPVNTVPGAQSVNEDTPLAITGLSVADADDNIATVKLTVADGILNVTLYGSATVSDGANGSTSLTLTGSRADINTTLGTLTYQGNTDFNGNDTLTIRTTDTGGSSNTGTVAITVNPVNDAPEISASATSFSANMIGIAALDTQQITIADPDASSKPLQLTLVAESGKIHVDTGSRQITVLSGNNSANVTLSGTLVELNALLHGSDVDEGSISWSGTLESDARQIDLQITVDDQGNSGGNAKTATRHFTIDVPASHTNEPIVLDEDAEPLQLDPYLLFGVDATATRLAFSVSDVADPDLLDATISTTNGRSMLTLMPLADQHGETTIKLTAQTGTGNRIETTLNIIINSIPDAPVIAIQPIEGATNNAVRVLISPNSADGTDSDINFFYISGISGGELYYADGESKIENDSFISREEANAGLIFVPDNGVATPSTLRFSVLGAFNDRGLPPGAKAAEFSFDVQPPQVAQTPPPGKIELTDIPTPETLAHDDDQNTEDSGALLLRQAIKDAEEARQRGEPTIAITTTPPITIQPIHTMPVSEEALDDFSVLGNDGARKTVDRASFAQLITRYLDEIERQKDVLVVTSYEHLFESLERLRDEFHELDLSGRTVIGSAVVASAGLSAGYVVWMLRGGLLISSMMFSVPAWSIADPLTILAAHRDEEDDDSLEDIARKGARKKNENNYSVGLKIEP